MYEIFAQLLLQKGLKAADVCRATGIKSPVFSEWKKGKSKPNTEKMLKIANFLGVSIEYLMTGEEEPSKKHNVSTHSRHGVPINVLGRVAAGIPIEAVEEIIDIEEISEDMAKTGEFFGLQIHGDSMEPRMLDGDIVIVRKQDDAESGDIVIAMVNGDDATCKRIRKYKDGIELISNNPSYKPMYFSNYEIENKPVKIIGKVVELRGKF